MSDILPRHYIMGIIIFTFFIMGGVAMLSELTDAKDTYGDSEKYLEFNQTFNKIDNVTTEINELEEGIATQEADIGAFGMLNSLISGAWSSLKILFRSFGFMNTAINGLNSFFGVPAWIPLLIILMVTVLIVFAIFSAIFQREI